MTQSVYSSAGSYAETIVQLTHIMFVAAAVITLLVVVLTAIALFAKPSWKSKLSKERVVVWGGIAFPVVTLTILLFYGFMVLSMADLQIEEDESVQISVVGEQWWWRFTYTAEDGTTFETANELRIPTDKPIVLRLTSADVIHSFWIPAYGGKLDMIPGRENVMKIEVNKPGVYRGQCAEYCGGAHALMSMYSVAMPQEEFDAWLKSESADAASSADAKGKQIFLGNGCGSCHTIRGTTASGTIGPDLTHVGSRISLAAGTLRTSKENFAGWIANHKQIKPENKMPDYDYLSDVDVEQLATFLYELK